MLSLDALREYGANVDAGLTRCMNNEQFFFRMIGMLMNDTGVEKLESALASKDLAAAFEIAHAMKGVVGNLALEPIYRPVSEMTELLRAGKEADYDAYLTQIRARFEELESICRN